MAKPLLAVVALLLPISVYANITNVGFVDDLWFSSDQPLTEEPLRIYSSLVNSTDKDISGTIIFLVNDEEIDSLAVQILAGRKIEVWADWKPTSGTSSVTASLTDLRAVPISGDTESLATEIETSKDIFIDVDTDQDGLGNQTDKDDDGDGISDETELANGTDPLVADDPNTDQEVPESELSNQASETETAIGLEQYLTDSPARETLASITERITNTKKRLDEYRESRDKLLDTDIASSQSTSTASSSQNTYDNKGFGTVERSQNQSESASMLTAIVNVIKAAITGLYTFLLFILSTFLGHPVVVQLSLLLLILFILLKLAKRIGGRPQV